MLLTSYAYDAAGRTQTVTDPKAITTKTFYDCLGRRTATVENYKAGDTYWTVEPLQPKDRKADECRITATTFDAAGNRVLLTAVDPNHDGSTADNQVTVYNYHDPYSASLVTRIKYPDSASAEWDSVTFTYDLDGALATRTSQKKAVGDAATVIAFDYDATFRRMTRQSVTQVGTGVDDAVLAMGYAYDDLGRRTTVTSYDDPETGNVLNQIQYTFNDLGMLVEEYQEHNGAKGVNTLHVEYAYDDTAPAGIYTKGMRPKSVRYPNARTVYTLYTDSKNQSPWEQSGISDAISRVTALASAASRGTSAEDDNVYAAYAYNGAGRIVLETQKNAGNTVAELDYYQGEAGTYAGFDRFGRVVDQKWHTAGTVKDRYGYGYDPNSNRTRRENVLAADRSEVYDYDMLDRLAGMDRGTLNEGKSAILGTPAREESWNLNQTGNWAGYHVKTDGAAVLDQTRTNNKANEITGIETPPEQTQWSQPEYDARGNMITVPKPNSPASAFTCTWDAWNRLIQVKDGETVVATYRYDGLTRRIRKIVAGSPEVTYDYYHNPARQILETRKNGDTDPYEQHVWGLRYVHSPVCRFYDPDTDGQNIQTHYYCNDANFNVTALVDTGGNVVERYTYAPYGKVTFRAPDWSERASSAYSNDILFTGHRLDTETGLYYGGWRYYHPTLGLWLSRDRDYYGGLGMYEYVAANPVGLLDPLGLQAVQHILKARLIITSRLKVYKGDTDNTLTLHEDPAVEPTASATATPEALKYHWENILGSTIDSTFTPTWTVNVRYEAEPPEKQCLRGEISITFERIETWGYVKVKGWTSGTEYKASTVTFKFDTCGDREVALLADIPAPKLSNYEWYGRQTKPKLDPKTGEQQVDKYGNKLWEYDTFEGKTSYPPKPQHGDWRTEVEFGEEVKSTLKLYCVKDKAAEKGGTQ